MAARRNGAHSKGSPRTSVWLQAAKEPRSPPQLSRDRIVAAAVEVLDAHGVDGLTMRRLADHLGSGVMSLYWHVDNKEDVFELALDSVFAYRGVPAGGSRDWRQDITHMLEDWRASMLAHPWSASLLERPALGPNVLDRLELLGATLTQAGITSENLNFGVWSLYNHVMGATIVRASLNLSGDDRTASQQRLEHLGERYPTIHRSGLLMDDDWDATFRKGLSFLLDGLVPKS